MYVATEVEEFGMVGRPSGYLQALHDRSPAGLREQAWVVVTGRSEAVGHGAMANEVASQGAKRDGDEVASRSLMFTRCPQCNELDPAAAAYRWSRTLLAIGVALAFIVVGVVIARTMSSPMDLFAVLMPGTFGVISGLRLYLYLRRPWARAEHRVSFDRPTT